MEKRQLVVWMDRLGVALILSVALVLRSDLSYRTAFVDEALYMFGGWEMLQGQPANAISYVVGWPPLSFLPLGVAGWLGGVEAARGLNAALGTATVLVVMLIARQAYGKLAGYLAAGMFAVFGPAIHISTFATYDCQSVLLLGIGVYLWQSALSGDRKLLYALGSVATTLAVLTKYVALAPAAASATCVAIGVATRKPSGVGARCGRRAARGIDAGVLATLALMGLPLLPLPWYALRFREPLMSLWQGSQSRILDAGANNPHLAWDILKGLAKDLWLPFALSLLSLSCRGKRYLSVGLLATGLSVVAYHLLATECHAVVKHTCYALVALAPLVAGGLVETVNRLLGKRLRGLGVGAASGTLGIALIAGLALSGQAMLPGSRGYWADTTNLMRYLRGAVQEGDTMLVEQGVIAKYYLIEKGTPGHRPGQVVDTWWYQDEEGRGEAAYKRAIAQRRFDWVVFDYTVTPELDGELLPLVEGGYERWASFPARIYGQYGTIDVFKARP